MRTVPFEAGIHHRAGLEHPMNPTDSGRSHMLSHLQTEGASVPWTPRDIRADRSGTDRARDWGAVPFVVQDGPRMLMIGQTSVGWTLAELEFDRERCTFLEVRQATYTWPREAFGVLLSRLTASNPTSDMVERLTHEFAAWVGFSFARIPQ